MPSPPPTPPPHHHLQHHRHPPPSIHRIHHPIITADHVTTSTTPTSSPSSLPYLHGSEPTIKNGVQPIKGVCFDGLAAASKGCVWLAV
ncbi:hypothetical protein Tco_0308834 [Tanacetum coccineum]